MDLRSYNNQLPMDTYTLASSLSLNQDRVQTSSAALAEQFTAHLLQDSTSAPDGFSRVNPWDHGVNPWSDEHDCGVVPFKNDQTGNITLVIQGLDTPPFDLLSENSIALSPAQSHVRDILNNMLEAYGDAVKESPLYTLQHPLSQPHFEMLQSALGESGTVGLVGVNAGEHGLNSKELSGALDFKLVLDPHSQQMALTIFNMEQPSTQTIELMKHTPSLVDTQISDFALLLNQVEQAQSESLLPDAENLAIIFSSSSTDKLNLWQPVIPSNEQISALVADIPHSVRDAFFSQGIEGFSEATKAAAMDQNQINSAQQKLGMVERFFTLDRALTLATDSGAVPASVGDGFRSGSQQAVENAISTLSSEQQGVVRESLAEFCTMAFRHEAAQKLELEGELKQHFIDGDLQALNQDLAMVDPSKRELLRAQLGNSCKDATSLGQLWNVDQQIRPMLLDGDTSKLQTLDDTLKTQLERYIARVATDQIEFTPHRWMAHPSSREQLEESIGKLFTETSIPIDFTREQFNQLGAVFTEMGSDEFFSQAAQKGLSTELSMQCAAIFIDAQRANLFDGATAQLTTLSPELAAAFSAGDESAIDGALNRLRINNPELSHQVTIFLKEYTALDVRMASVGHLQLNDGIKKAFIEGDADAILFHVNNLPDQQKGTVLQFLRAETLSSEQAGAAWLLPQQSRISFVNGNVEQARIAAGPEAAMVDAVEAQILDATDRLSFRPWNQPITTVESASQQVSVALGEHFELQQIWQEQGPVDFANAARNAGLDDLLIETSIQSLTTLDTALAIDKHLYGLDTQLQQAVYAGDENTVWNLLSTYQKEEFDAVAAKLVGAYGAHNRAELAAALEMPSGLRQAFVDANIEHIQRELQTVPLEQRPELRKELGKMAQSAMMPAAALLLPLEARGPYLQGNTDVAREISGDFGVNKANQFVDAAGLVFQQFLPTSAELNEQSVALAQQFTDTGVSAEKWQELQNIWHQEGPAAFREAIVEITLPTSTDVLIGVENSAATDTIEKAVDKALNHYWFDKNELFDGNSTSYDNWKHDVAERLFENDWDGVEALIEELEINDQSVERDTSRALREVDRDETLLTQSKIYDHAETAYNQIRAGIHVTNDDVRSMESFLLSASRSNNWESLCDSFEQQGMDEIADGLRFGDFKLVDNHLKSLDPGQQMAAREEIFNAAFIDNLWKASAELNLDSVTYPIFTSNDANSMQALYTVLRPENPEFSRVFDARVNAATQALAFMLPAEAQDAFLRGDKEAVLAAVPQQLQLYIEETFERVMLEANPPVYNEIVGDTAHEAWANELQNNMQNVPAGYQRELANDALKTAQSGKDHVMIGGYQGFDYKQINDPGSDGTAFRIQANVMGSFHIDGGSISSETNTLVLDDGANWRVSGNGNFHTIQRLDSSDNVVAEFTASNIHLMHEPNGLTVDETRWVERPDRMQSNLFSKILDFATPVVGAINPIAGAALGVLDSAIDGDWLDAGGGLLKLAGMATGSGVISALGDTISASDDIARNISKGDYLGLISTGAGVTHSWGNALGSDDLANWSQIVGGGADVAHGNFSGGTSRLANGLWGEGYIDQNAASVLRGIGSGADFVRTGNPLYLADTATHILEGTNSISQTAGSGIRFGSSAVDMFVNDFSDVSVSRTGARLGQFIENIQTESNASINNKVEYNGIPVNKIAPLLEIMHRFDVRDVSGNQDSSPYLFNPDQIASLPGQEEITIADGSKGMGQRINWAMVAQDLNSGANVKLPVNEISTGGLQLVQAKLANQGLFISMDAIASATNGVDDINVLRNAENGQIVLRGADVRDVGNALVVVDEQNNSSVLDLAGKYGIISKESLRRFVLANEDTFKQLFGSENEWVNFKQRVLNSNPDENVFFHEIARVTSWVPSANVVLNMNYTNATKITAEVLANSGNKSLLEKIQSSEDFRSFADGNVDMYLQRDGRVTIFSANQTGTVQTFERFEADGTLSTKTRTFTDMSPQNYLFDIGVYQRNENAIDGSERQERFTIAQYGPGLANIALNGTQILNEQSSSTYLSTGIPVEKGDWIFENSDGTFTRIHDDNLLLYRENGQLLFSGDSQKIALTNHDGKNFKSASEFILINTSGFAHITGDGVTPFIELLQNAGVNNFDSNALYSLVRNNAALSSFFQSKIEGTIIEGDSFPPALLRMTIPRDMSISLNTQFNHDAGVTHQAQIATLNHLRQINPEVNYIYRLPESNPQGVTLGTILSQLGIDPNENNKQALLKYNPSLILGANGDSLRTATDITGNLEVLIPSNLLFAQEERDALLTAHFKGEDVTVKAMQGETLADIMIQFNIKPGQVDLEEFLMMNPWLNFVTSKNHLLFPEAKAEGLNSAHPQSIVIPQDEVLNIPHPMQSSRLKGLLDSMTSDITRFGQNFLENNTPDFLESVGQLYAEQRSLFMVKSLWDQEIPLGEKVKIFGGAFEGKMSFGMDNRPLGQKINESVSDIDGVKAFPYIALAGKFKLPEKLYGTDVYAEGKITLRFPGVSIQSGFNDENFELDLTRAQVVVELTGGLTKKIANLDLPFIPEAQGYVKLAGSYDPDDKSWSFDIQPGLTVKWRRDSIHGEERGVVGSGSEYWRNLGLDVQRPIYPVDPNAVSENPSETHDSSTVAHLQSHELTSNSSESESVTADDLLVASLLQSGGLVSAPYIFTVPYQTGPLSSITSNSDDSSTIWVKPGDQGSNSTLVENSFHTVINKQPALNTDSEQNFQELLLSRQEGLFDTGANVNFEEVDLKVLELQQNQPVLVTQLPLVNGSESLNIPNSGNVFPPRKVLPEYRERVDQFNISQPQDHNDNSCGTSSLSRVLTYHDPLNPIHHDKIDESIRQANTWTSPDNIIDFARERGMNAEMYNNSSVESIKAYLAQGMPPIVLIRSGAFTDMAPTQNHYVVAVGTGTHTFANGKTAEAIYIDDPFNGKIYALPIDEFEERWRTSPVPVGFNNFMIMVTPESTPLPEGTPRTAATTLMDTINDVGNMLF